MTISATLALALLTFLTGIGASVLGYFVLQLTGLGKRTGRLEQSSAAQAQAICSLTDGFARVETKLDRALGYRGEMPSSSEG